MNIVVTDHAHQRIVERIGIPPDEVIKLVRIAYYKGINSDRLTKTLKAYIEKRSIRYESTNEIKLYNDYLFVFCGQLLITVLSMPNYENYKKLENLGIL